MFIYPVSDIAFCICFKLSEKKDKPGKPSENRVPLLFQEDDEFSPEEAAEVSGEN